MSNKRNATRRKSSKRLRICLYARYSTEEQDESSIPDQFAYCKRELKALGIDLDTAIIEEHSDAETSGEIVYRPGIDQVREGVFNNRWDIIVAEDVSRWFRNLSACCELVETAYDNGMRIIAFNDDVDSDEEGWEDRFYEAARHHAKTNRYTSHRIKRKLEALWEKGAAIGLLRPGYNRIRPKQEFTGLGRRRRKNSKFDEIDKKWNQVVYKAFERIAAGEEPWVVADWLTKMGLPKCGNAKSKAWTDPDVIALIRRTVYRGHDTYRKTVSQRKIRTGKKSARWNEPEFVLTREMSHLRIVPDWLWYAANAKIDDRMVKKNTPRGDDHCLTGIPRDSRYPLSNLFVCDICQQKMWADGRNEGGYRCSCARKPSTGLSLCWNKATARREVAHRAISRAVTRELFSLDGVLDTLVTHIQRCVHDDAAQEQETERLNRMASALRRECDRLGDAIAGEDAAEAPETLVRKLREREESLAETEADLERLRQSAASPQEISTDDIAQRIGQVAEQLLDLDRTSGALLGRLIDGKIRAVPHVQFGGEKDKVVFRARFTFHPVGILPDQLLAALSGTELDDLGSVLPKREITVDLFEPSLSPKHAMDALKLKEDNPKLSLAKIGNHLDISKRSAHLALELGQKMREAGITDPFIPLTKRPTNPSRWRDGRSSANSAA